MSTLRRVLIHLSFIMILVDYGTGLYQLLNNNYLEAVWMLILGTILLYTFSSLSHLEYEKRRGENDDL